MAPRRFAPLLAVVLLALIAPPLEAQTGFLVVTVSTTGPISESTRYFVGLESQNMRPVAPNGSVVFRRVPAGSSTVTLDVPESCMVRGRNPQETVVVANEAIDLEFAVDCAVAGMEERQRVREEAAAAPPVERQVQRATGAAQFEGRDQAMVVMAGVEPESHGTIRAGVGETGNWSVRGNGGNDALPHSLRHICSAVATRTTSRPEILGELDHQKRGWG
jgi:hypothetical protein